MDYRIIIRILDIILMVTILGFPLYGFNCILNYIVSWKHYKRVPHSDKLTRFAILIPARRESPRVIKHICKSLLTQTYNKEYFDAYFIVEEEDDPSIETCHKYGFKHFVRNNITDDRHTKGCALQECIEYLRKGDVKYDAYMIFDADNVLESNYIETMNDMRQAGFEIGMGYRNFTNCSENIFASSSSLLFLNIMASTGQARSNLYNKFSVTGTGYYINADIIEEMDGWKFLGMTEDTELTRYCYKHDIKMKITTRTTYYDEQTTKFKVWHNQHVRWIWGYLIKESRKQEIKGVDHHNSSKRKLSFARFEYAWSFIPFAILNAILVASILVNAGFALAYFLMKNYDASTEFAIRTVGLVLGVWGEFALIALLLMIKERKRTKFTFFAAIAAILWYWIMFFDIVVAFFDGLFNKKKRREWKVIPHSGKIKNKKAKNLSRGNK